MIQYPFLDKGSTIGVIGPSFGVGTKLKEVLETTCKRMERKGYHVICGSTAWTQDKVRSAPAKIRAIEFNEMMKDEKMDVIFPPKGGELLIEILEQIDFENMQNKWVIGYSDISLLLLAITLKTGIATAHGTNFLNLRGEYSDQTTAMWESVLSTKKGDFNIQYSSEKYQKEWQYDKPTPYVFHLTEPTYWKTLSNEHVKLEGRLLGGCIDVIRHLIGTPYGDVSGFRQKHIGGEPIVWFLENCELSSTDLRRSLIQMKLAGWFDECSGILFGRSASNKHIKGYTAEDVYRELSEELAIPIIYDVDCGHIPPQITWINGAYAEIDTFKGQGKVRQYFT